MSNPFTSVTVQPSYGSRKTLVTWTVLDEYEDGDFYVLRSPDGVRSWKLLNVVPANNFQLEDDLFIVDNRVQVTHYRVYLKHPTLGEFDSPPIGLFDTLTRSEYGIARNIMLREIARMHNGRNAVEVLHYIPLASGTPNPHYDPDTNQKYGAECPSTGPEDASYGLPFIGGYGLPIRTWVELKSMAPEVTSVDNAGLGNTEQVVVRRARMVAAPKPHRGHLLVNVHTDDRYAVGEEIIPYRFRGVAPVAYDVTLHLLRRGDPRYRVPIPNPLPDYYIQPSKNILK